MATMIAVPILAIVGLIVTLVWWPGALPGLAILLVIGWMCSKYADKIGQEHHR